MNTPARSVVVPYSGGVPAQSIQAAVASILGDQPGKGLIQIRVVEQVPPPPGFGPGTELKQLLSRIGIAPKPGCKCLARAIEMDIRGCDWCERNQGIIVGWLREEAANRGLPFVDAAGSLLVRRAISNARRASRDEKRQ